MKNINYSKEYFNNYLSKHKLNTSGYNSESTIYVDRKNLIKLFESHIDKEAKRFTLDMLDERRKVLTINTPEIVLPERTVSVDGEFMGYSMKYLPGVTLDTFIEDINVPFYKKREVMVKLGELLEKMSKLRSIDSNCRDLYLNDLHFNNVIVTPDLKVKIIDSDSIKVNGNKTYAALYLNQPYDSKMYKLDGKYVSDDYSVLPNENSDLYCYIMMVINFLYGSDLSIKGYASYNYLIDKMEIAGLNHDLAEIMRNVYEEGNNINPCNLLKKQREIII